MTHNRLRKKKYTFMLRSLVITSTASFDRGTGDPIPMSSPVSRGSNFGTFPVEPVSAGSVTLDNNSGFPVLWTSVCKWSGGAGTNLSSLGVESMPSLPIFLP